MPKIASSVGMLGTETALDVLVKARAVEARGRKVIHLEVGEPDFPTPGHIVEAGIRALRDGYTRYGAPGGSQTLREAICEHLAEREVRASPEHVVVTPGAKPNLFYGFLATISPGDEVLIPDPGFPIYASMVRFCGATPVSVPPRLDQGRALDLDALERSITPRTRMIVFNSPSNPTGAIVPDADLQRLAALAERHDLWVMADEIYRRICYGNEAPSIAALPGMFAPFPAPAQRSRIASSTRKRWRSSTAPGSARVAPDISACPSPRRSNISRRRRIGSSASSHGCKRLAGPRKGATPSPTRARRRPGCGCRRPACPSTCARARRGKGLPAARWVRALLRGSGGILPRAQPVVQLDPLHLAGGALRQLLQHFDDLRPKGERQLRLGERAQARSDRRVARVARDHERGGRLAHHLVRD